jgi:myo-inositol-hexaphosphate 3-phosphohydrolase
MSFTATLSDDLVAPLPANTSTAMNLSRSGQNGRYTFNATAGTTIGVQLGGLVTTPVNQAASLTVLKPDGTTLTSGSANPGYTFNLANLPATGTYTVFVDPANGATANISATYVAGGSSTVPVGGTPASISTSSNGQYAYFNFTATQGENLGLGINNLVVTDSSTNKSYGINYTVYKPDGTSWKGNTCQVSSGGCEMNLSNAPTTGTYSVVVQPWPYATGTLNFNATLSDDVVVSLPANTATTMSLSRNGQNGRYTFDATAGTTVGVQVGGITTTPVNQTAGLTVLKPDGTTLASGSASAGYTFNLANLPVTGTYTVFVDPVIGATATLSATYVASGSVVIPTGGTPASISTTASGQYAYFNFTATQGENLGLGINDLVITDTSTNKSTYVYVTVYKPDGTTWTSNGSCQGGACDLNLGNAPMTGTYSVMVQPYPYLTGTMSFTATLSDDLVVPLPANTVTTMSLSRNGQNGRYTFDATAGTTVGVQIGGITTTPANQTVGLKVLKPDGTTLASASASAGYTFNLANLPVTGTYIVFVDPANGATAALSAMYVASGSAVVPTGGTPASISTTASGQYAYFNFTATQGENLGLGISNLVITDTSTNKSTYAYVTVYKPDGTAWTSNGNCQGGACDLNLTNAPVTGTYSVMVQPYPYLTGTMSFTATLSDDLVVPLPANTATMMSLSRNGQNGRYTFSGMAATTVSIQISGITTTPASQTVYLTVLKSDGTTLASSSATTAYTFNLTNLPVAGTYTVFVNPQYGVKANLSATLTGP